LHDPYGRFLLATKGAEHLLLADHDEGYYGDRKQNVCDQAVPELGFYSARVRLYQEHVLQANEGCDLDFLRGT
jgi:hypothetical protein